MISKLLLHICCFPCLDTASGQILKQGWEEVSGVFYNPNIHPYSEYRNRLKALKENSARLSLPGFKDIIEPEYDYRNFLCSVMALTGDARCEACFTIRFTVLAKLALEKGFHNISTTLMVSPFQKRELMEKTADRIASGNDLRFVRLDVDNDYSAKARALKEKGIFVQKYCGCIFSEYERYAVKKKDRRKEVSL